MHLVRSSRWLASLAALGACSPELLRPAPPEAAPVVHVELRVEGGLPLVEGRLPGAGDGVRAWFLIDTGAGDFTLLDESLTTALRLKHELVHEPRLPGIGFSTTLAFLEVDGMGRRDVTAYVTEELAARPELAGLSVPVQGVLGTGYFRGRCLGFDWARGRFTANQPRMLATRQVPIPLRYGTAGELFATLRVNGSEAVALVDTGSAETLVAQELADRVGIAYDRADVSDRRETAVGLATVHASALGRLALGTEELAAVPVLVVERRFPNAEVVLGTDVLRRYGVILDLSERPYLVLDPQEGRAEAGTGPGA